MSTQTKDWLSKWSPLILAILSGWGMFFGFKATTESEIAGLKKSDEELHALIIPTDKLIQILVTRAEFDMRTKARDVETAEMKRAILDLGDKLERVRAELGNKIDRLSERTLTANGKTSFSQPIPTMREEMDALKKTD